MYLMYNQNKRVQGFKDSGVQGFERTTKLLVPVNLMSYVGCNLVIPACQESFLRKDSRQALHHTVHGQACLPAGRRE